MGYVQADVKITGLNEAIAGFKAMGAEKEIQALNFEVGKLVTTEAKKLAPVLTGRLRDSIRPSKTIKSVVVYAGRGNSIPYGNPQNWGWFYDRKNMQPKNILPKQFMNKGAAKVRPWIAQHYMQKLIAIFEKKAKTD